MKKSEIIEKIVAQTGIEKPTVAAVVEEIMLAIKNSMANGENIYLRGFGTFLLRKRAAKKARNITKGTVVNVPAHIIPAFKPAKEFAGRIKRKVKVS